MFTTKTIALGNTTKELMWIARDASCFDLIKHDWHQFSSFFLPLVRDRGTVVQAGGNCGLYPLYYSYLFERVFTFEPDPMNFYCLSHNCPNNKIIKFNIALSGVAGFVSMANPDPSNVGMHRVIPEGGTQVYGMSLDSLEIPSVGLIHLDVEGFEYPVLLGSQKTIERTRPVVVLEMSTCESEMMQIMKDLNYKVSAYYGDPINRVFVPKEWK